MKKKSFVDFDKQKAKEFGIEPQEGLSGYDDDGAYAYKHAPQKGRGIAKTGSGDPLPFSNPDEPHDLTGKVWVARDSDGRHKPLGSEMTKGMDKAVNSKEMKLTDLDQVLETDPPYRWSKFKNSIQKEAPLNKIKKKKILQTNEEFRKFSQEKSTGEILDSLKSEDLPTILDINGNEFVPEPNQTIQFLAEVLSKNPRLMRRFVNEMRNRNAFGDILENMMQHNIYFDKLVEMFGSKQGERFAHRLSLSLHDNTKLTENTAYDASEYAHLASEKAHAKSNGNFDFHKKALDLAENPKLAMNMHRSASNAHKAHADKLPAGEGKKAHEMAAGHHNLALKAHAGIDPISEVVAASPAERFPGTAQMKNSQIQKPKGGTIAGSNDQSEQGGMFGTGVGGKEGGMFPDLNKGDANTNTLNEPKSTERGSVGGQPGPAGGHIGDVPGVGGSSMPPGPGAANPNYGQSPNKMMKNKMKESAVANLISAFSRFPTLKNTIREIIY